MTTALLESAVGETKVCGRTWDLWLLSQTCYDVQTALCGLAYCTWHRHSCQETVDPEQLPHSAASDMDLHMSLERVKLSCIGK